MSHSIRYFDQFPIISIHFYVPRLYWHKFWAPSLFGLAARLFSTTPLAWLALLTRLMLPFSLALSHLDTRLTTYLFRGLITARVQFRGFFTASCLQRGGAASREFYPSPCSTCLAPRCLISSLHAALFTPSLSFTLQLFSDSSTFFTTPHETSVPHSILPDYPSNQKWGIYFFGMRSLSSLYFGDHLLSFQTTPRTWGSTSQHSRFALHPQSLEGTVLWTAIIFTLIFMPPLSRPPCNVPMPFFLFWVMFFFTHPEAPPATAFFYHRNGLHRVLGPLTHFCTFVCGHRIWPVLGLRQFGFSLMGAFVHELRGKERLET